MEQTNNTCALSCPQLQQYQNQYNTMLSKFSHELRNPLTLINSSLQLIENDCPSVLSSSLWSQLRQDVSDTIRLLQTLTSLGQACRSIPMQKICITDFLTKINNSFQPSMREHQITFKFFADPALSKAAFYGNEIKLREALTNLLVNAIDALSESRISRQSIHSAPEDCISLSASLNDKYIVIHVRDNGPGIPAEYLDTIFETFTTHKAHGTGLGLGISRDIARQHGGDLTVSTSTAAPDSFTDFCLRLSASCV